MRERFLAAPASHAVALGRSHEWHQPENDPADRLATRRGRRHQDPVLSRRADVSTSRSGHHVVCRAATEGRRRRRSNGAAHAGSCVADPSGDGTVMACQTAVGTVPATVPRAISRIASWARSMASKAPVFRCLCECQLVRMHANATWATLAGLRDPSHPSYDTPSRQQGSTLTRLRACEPVCHRRSVGGCQCVAGVVVHP